MPDSNLDWTFDLAPQDRFDQPHKPETDQPAPRPPRGRGRWVWPLVFFIGLAGAGGGLAGYGWSKVRAEVSARVRQEEALALARDGRQLRTLQAPGLIAWSDLRASQAALGLAAPLPAPNLLPVDAPLEISAIRAGYANLVEVTVVRSYADSAGQMYRFDLVQRYRSPEPGQWQRLPPDPQKFQRAVEWRGGRLTAIYPEVDGPWLKAALPLIDADLQAICAQWNCPAETQAPIVFVSDLASLQPNLPARAELRPARAYPIIFDLPVPPINTPRRLVLPALALTGTPHDQAAASALRRALTVQALAYLAEEVSTSQRGATYFLDGLVARAEMRLGLYTPPADSLYPDAFTPPAQLWNGYTRADAEINRPDIALGLETLDFLNFALINKSAGMEAELLRTLSWNRQMGLEEWLQVNLWAPGSVFIDGWLAQSARAFAARGPANWNALNGLAYSCPDGLNVVRHGQVEPIAGVERSWLTTQSFSPDGRYLALIAPQGEDLLLADLERGAWRPLASGREADLLGWSAGGQLLYLLRPNGGGCPGRACQLIIYQPLSATRTTIAEPLLVAPWPNAFSQTSLWSPDHTRLSLWLYTTSARLALARPDPTLTVAALPFIGYAPSWSPDGQRLAYLSGPAPWEINPRSPRQIEIFDLTREISTSVAAPIDLPGVGPSPIVTALDWAPDGASLLAAAYSDSFSGLYLVPLDGQPIRRLLHAASASLLSLGFSADGQYVGALGASDNSDLWLVELATGRSRRYRASFAGAAWAPTGHQIAIGGPAGAYVTDPSGDGFQWLTSGSCSVAWMK